MSFKKEIFENKIIADLQDGLTEEEKEAFFQTLGAWADMWDSSIFSKLEEVISKKETAKKFIDELEGK